MKYECDYIPLYFHFLEIKTAITTVSDIATAKVSTVVDKQ